MLGAIFTDFRMSAARRRIEHVFDQPPPFVHLNVRSYFSIKDGAFSPEDLALRAAALGMPAVALVDRDGLYGAPRFADACRQVSERVAPVRPILGATLTVRTLQHRRGGPRAARRRGRQKGDPSSAGGARPQPVFVDRSVVVLAKDATGYANL